jgi:hypothetical protein
VTEADPLADVSSVLEHLRIVCAKVNDQSPPNSDRFATLYAEVMALYGRSLQAAKIAELEVREAETPAPASEAIRIGVA